MPTPYTFTLRVTDSTGATATLERTINAECYTPSGCSSKPFWEGVGAVIDISPFTVGSYFDLFITAINQDLPSGFAINTITITPSTGTPIVLLEGDFEIDVNEGSTTWEAIVSWPSDFDPVTDIVSVTVDTSYNEPDTCSATYVFPQPIQNCASIDLSDFSVSTFTLSTEPYFGDPAWNATLTVGTITGALPNGGTIEVGIGPPGGDVEGDFFWTGYYDAIAPNASTATAPVWFYEGLMDPNAGDFDLIVRVTYIASDNETVCLYTTPMPFQIRNS